MAVWAAASTIMRSVTVCCGYSCYGSAILKPVTAGSMYIRRSTARYGVCCLYKSIESVSINPVVSFINLALNISLHFYLCPGLQLILGRSFYQKSITLQHLGDTVGRYIHSCAIIVPRERVFSNAGHIYIVSEKKKLCLLPDNVS